MAQIVLVGFLDERRFTFVRKTRQADVVQTGRMKGSTVNCRVSLLFYRLLRCKAAG